MIQEQNEQENLLLKEGIRLMRKDRLQLSDISETWLLRKLVVGMFSSSATERQWAVKELMALKGMKPQTKKKAKEDGAVEKAMAELKSVG